jgi:hypothetical protein
MACAVVHRAVTHSLARSAVTPLRDIGPSVAAALHLIASHPAVRLRGAHHIICAA